MRKAGLRPEAETTLAVLILAAAVVLAFGPILSNGFVNWDDDVFLLRNEAWRGLDGPHLRWMFSSFAGGVYQPLPWIIFALIFKAQGLAPVGYHAASLVVHAANAAALYFVLLRLAPPSDRNSWFAALAAGLLWAAHPAQAQIVAWAPPLSILLSTFFFLLSVLAYLRAAEGPERRRWLGLSLFCYTASGLCGWKGYALPLALVALDFAPLRRLSLQSWRRPAVWVEKLPFLVVFAALLWVNVLSKGATRGQFHFAPRPTEACAAVLLYLTKLVAPFDLIPLYALNGPANPLGWSGGSCLAGAAGLTAGLSYFSRRNPGPLAAWLFFLASVLPLVVLTPPGPVFVSLIYLYISTLGFAALVFEGLRRWRPARWIAIGLLPLLIGLSRSQSRRWHDSITLWSHTLAVDPDAYVARNNLGAALLDAGRPGEAETLFREELARHPDDDLARLNLAAAMAAQTGNR